MRTLLLAALLVTAACDSTGREGDAAPGEAGRAPVAGEPAVTLALLPANAAGASAAVTGTLAVRRTCLVVETPQGPINLAFAGDARWDGSALSFGGRSYATGSRVTLSGARFEGDAARLAWVRAPAADCAVRPWIVYSIDPA